MSKAKILVYDIETSPLLSYTWGTFKQNVIEVAEDFQILCFAYKWLGERGTHIVAQNDFEDYEPGVNDDLHVVKKLHELFDEADVVVAHNGDKFDQKRSQARMLAHGMSPPSPYRQIDTLKVARKYASFTSNRLNELGKKLGLGEKLETGGFETWKGCVAGDKSAWNKMKKYNKQDVKLLEQVYYRLRPWINNHPAMNLLDGRPDSCPKCGSGPLLKRGTLKTNKVTTHQRYQCKACGGWSQGRLSTKHPVVYVN